MKIGMIAIILIILSFIASNKSLASDVLSHENFDLYKINDKSLFLFDCEIDGVIECEYNDALPIGKKSTYPDAIYFGTGRLNYTKIDAREDAQAKEKVQRRIVAFRLMHRELDKSLSKGISMIKSSFPQEYTCIDPEKRNYDFKNILTKLEAKIKERREREGKTKDVLEGQVLLEKLQCY